ncbi:carboxymuconolactone decarboxylase family protein [Desertibaculum subflavum]|uniref:carboxymuconolactone decarboxylase family protein n=1 Tax=Desertibaculum subflavum TaxID=2268458 RepID=UPI000E66C60A
MRIGAQPIASYPWYLRPFFWNQRRKYGQVLDAALLWARSPRLFLGVAVLYGMIDRRQSPIEPALRSLITVRVSQINGCAFCVDLNAATLAKRGVDEGKIERLAEWRRSELFTARERATLDYAEAVTRSDQRVEDRHVAALRRHLDDDAIVELTGLIAFQNMSSKFNSALDVPPQGFCRIPIPIDELPAAGREADKDATRMASENRASEFPTSARS